MMNESLIRLVTALAGKWKEEHLVPVRPRSRFVTTRRSILSSAAKICACTRSPAELKKKKKAREWGEGGKRTEWLCFLGRKWSESEAD